MRNDVPIMGDSPRPRAIPVGQMFDRIAPTYDLVNHLLSLGRDFSWRRRLAEQLGENGAIQVIDLATGTGDLLICLLRAHEKIVRAVGLDISEKMLAVCSEKLRRHNLAERAELLCAEALAMPFADGVFDAATMAFGIRYTPDAAATLEEIHRILKPGGMALILEFSLPRHRLLRWTYLKYLRFALPSVGALVSGDRHAYRYLNESIESFCRTQDLSSVMQQAGFGEISVIPLSLGVASIYRGVRLE
jgi:demethylmenaquinone methyltransferase/2-methoxy-6-polyprenyl-1,4-benzoquinol methylase